MNGVSRSIGLVRSSVDSGRADHPLVEEPHPCAGTGTDLKTFALQRGAET
jgi:hypothetical protein